MILVEELIHLTLQPDATALASDILLGKTAYARGNKIEGTIPFLESKTYIPANTDQIISSGNYINGNQIIKGDINLKSDNIKDGIVLFDGTENMITGIYKGTTETIMSVSAEAGPKATATISTSIDVTDVSSVEVTCHCSSNGNNSEGYVKLGSTKYSKCSGYNGSWSGTQTFDTSLILGPQTLTIYSRNESSNGSVSSSLSKVILNR